MPVIYNKKVEYAYTDPGVKAHTLSWAEYQALSEDDKMNGDLYFIPDKQPEGNPSRIWTKLGTDPLTTQADDVSGAVNELNSSLTPKEFTVTAGENITITMQKCYKIGKLAVLKITAKATQNITGSKIIINFPSGMITLQPGTVFISGQGSQWGISNFEYTYLTTNGIITDKLTANTFIHIDTTFVIA